MRVDSAHRNRTVATWSRAVVVAAIAVILACVGCGQQSDAQRPIATTWGEPAGVAPRGVVLLLPGGGWQPPSPASYRQEEALGTLIQRGGFATVTVEYGPGVAGFHQIESVYAEARRRYPGVPICALGLSAGGHLALMLAIHHQGLDCVIDLAGPTDLRTLAKQGSPLVYQGAVKAFGSGALGSWSPVRHAHAIDAKVLMVYAANDRIVPLAQADELKRVLPDAGLVVLPRGSAAFVHSRVDPAALARASRRQEAFLETVGSQN
jgi:acetyl esterase/lipase